MNIYSNGFGYWVGIKKIEMGLDGKNGFRIGIKREGIIPVSYTHLTLPTIYSV